MEEQSETLIHRPSTWGLFEYRLSCFFSYKYHWGEYEDKHTYLKYDKKGSLLIKGSILFRYIAGQNAESGHRERFGLRRVQAGPLADIRGPVLQIVWQRYYKQPVLLLFF